MFQGQDQSPLQGYSKTWCYCRTIYSQTLLSVKEEG